jgi:hypothetical protein
MGLMTCERVYISDSYFSIIYLFRYSPSLLRVRGALFRTPTHAEGRDS